MQYFDLIKPKLLTWDFLSQYVDKEPPFGPLGLIVYYRTYSRYVEELGRRERWWETVLRVVEYSMSLYQGPAPTSELVLEAQELYDHMFHLKVFPSGRSLWVGGTKLVEKDSTCNFNCSYCSIDSLKAYKDMFHLLLVGAGVGYSVEAKYVEMLPSVNSGLQVYHKPYEGIAPEDRAEFTYVDRHQESGLSIVIGDSREGWVDALYKFLLAATKGYQEIELVYDNVRPAGERLKTMGGRASGFAPLRTMFVEISAIIQNAGGKLSSVDAMDIANSIAKAVVVGGVRRSSLISLGDITDDEFITAKKDLWSDPAKAKFTTTRVMSNNSVMCWKKPSKEYLAEIFQSIRTTGEPGFINAEAASKRRPNFKGVNPCFTHDTQLLTSEGYYKIGELQGQEVELINWQGAVSKGKVWYTGDKDVVKVRLSNGERIGCTPDHVFKTLIGDYEAKDLKDKQLYPYIKSPTLQKEYQLLGFVQGDGCLGRLASAEHKGVEVNVGAKDGEILSLMDEVKWIYKYHGDTKVYVSDIKATLQALGFSDQSMAERTLPSTYSSWTLLQKASFLNGCYSANGSVLQKGRVTYKAICRAFIEQLQSTLLQDFGIGSYITTNRAKEVQFTNGLYTCKESYDLNIQNYRDVTSFFNQINFIHSYKRDRLAQHLFNKSPYVTSVVNDGNKPVYDFNEPLTNWGVVGGFVAHNCGEVLMDTKGLCNLSEINVFSFVRGRNSFDVGGFLKAVRLAARIGSRMTTVAVWDAEWDFVQKRDRLLGVSLTGQVEAWDALGWGYEINEEGYTYKHDDRITNLLANARYMARLAANEYHDEMTIPRSLLVTCTKPSGTLSNLPGVSSGVHRPYSPFYLRRVRISKNDPVALALRAKGLTPKPENGQGNDLDSDECNTWVFTFPVRTNAPIRSIDERAVDQLERYKEVMDNYVEHNCSVTISVAEDEWDEVVEWLYEDDNWNSFVGVSFLPKYDSSNTPYPQLPYEACDQATYEQFVQSQKEITEEELVHLINLFENSPEEYSLENDCTSGSCPVR